MDDLQKELIYKLSEDIAALCRNFVNTCANKEIPEAKVIDCLLLALTGNAGNIIESIYQKEYREAVLDSYIEQIRETLRTKRD